MIPKAKTIIVYKSKYFRIGQKVQPSCFVFLKTRKKTPKSYEYQAEFWDWNYEFNKSERTISLFFIKSLFQHREAKYFDGSVEDFDAYIAKELLLNE